jgi:hypothetical protein
MTAFLKNHPFAVEAFFETSLVLTFAIAKEELAALIPPCLELDTFNDKWAFIAVAMVQTRDLRPKGFPRIMGNDFFLIGYRIFVRYTNNADKRLRGLFILKSETDRKKMEWLGNIFTRYRYSTTDIIQSGQAPLRKIQSTGSGFEVEIDTGLPTPPLPPLSPFADWKEARRFAGPLPFTFSYNPATKQVLIIEGVRTHWQPTPVSVVSYDIAFLHSLRLTSPRLANAFIVSNIPYHWKKGKTELWHG